MSTPRCRSRHGSYSEGIKCVFPCYGLFAEYFCGPLLGTMLMSHGVADRREKAV